MTIIDLNNPRNKTINSLEEIIDDIEDGAEKSSAKDYVLKKLYIVKNAMHDLDFKNHTRIEQEDDGED